MEMSLIDDTFFSTIIHLKSWLNIFLD